MKFIVTAFIAGLLLLSGENYAQSRESWNTLEVSFSLDSNFSAAFLNDYFISEDLGLYQWNVTGYMIYHWDSWFKTVGLGYRYQPTIEGVEDHEHRILIEPKNKFRWGMWDLNIRNRVELRWHTAYDNSVRLRHRLTLKTNNFETLNYFASSEINKNSYETRYKRVRSMAGVFRQIWGVSVYAYLAYQHNLKGSSSSDLHMIGLYLAKAF